MRFVLFFTLTAMGCSKSVSTDSGASTEGTNNAGEESEEQGSGTDDQNDGESDGTEDTNEDTPGESFTGDAADLIADASSAVCDAMFRCCDGDSHDWFFQAWRSNTLVADRVDDMPPNTPLDPSTCPALVADLMVETWLGDWATALESGMVQMDPTGAAACIADLQEATCGDALRETLMDSTCFSQVAPAGGEEQRRFLQRTAVAGTTCMPVGDGFGGLYYGTCNPNEAFCCINDGAGDCNPFPMVGEMGSCTSVASDGQACSQEAPLQMCQTGSTCMGGVCMANASASLSVGEACYEPSTYTLLGDCAEGWCDMFGSKECESLKSDRETCTTGEECTSEWCDATERVCTENPICNG